MANQVKKSISKLSYKLNNIIDFNYSTFKVLYVCTFYFWRQLSAETKLFSQVLVMWRDIMSRVQNKLNALQITISTGVLDVLKICNEHLENIKKSLEVNYGTRSAAVLWSSLQNLPQGGHLSVSPSPVPPPRPQQLSSFSLASFGLMKMLSKENKMDGLTKWPSSKEPVLPMPTFWLL